MGKSIWMTLTRRSMLWLALLLPSMVLTQEPIALKRGINTFPWLYQARSIDNKVVTAEFRA